MAKKNINKKGPENSSPEEHKKDSSPYVFQRNKINFEINIRDLEWSEKQKKLIEIALDKKTRIIFINGPAGTSKAQPLDADILTPSGWKKMGELKIGDEVYSQDGEPTSVLGVFPQGRKKIYRVYFSDGTTTECCGDHLWYTQTSNERHNRTRIKGKRAENLHEKNPKPGKVRTTLEIKNTLYRANSKRPNHYIPITKPVVFPEKELLIHPYVLGVILGDGGISQNVVAITSADQEIIRKVQSLMPEGIKINKKSSEYDYLITDEESSWVKPNRIKAILNELGLMGKLSYEKFIPEDFKFNSIENRLELLRGLMDTDGTTQGTHTSFTSTSEKLAKDVIFLVQSLGGTASVSKYPSHYFKNGAKVQCRDAYCVHVKLPNEFNPFSLSRKAEKVKPNIKYFPRRSICNIEEIGEKECQCIYVEDETHTYLTNDFIVTHNTLLSVYASLHLLNEKKISDIIYLRSAVENSDSKLGFLPGSAEEKLAFYNLPFWDKIQELISGSDAKKLKDDSRAHTFPINYIRGLNWNSKSIILDEAQNSSYKELVTAMTRLGHFSRMFILADPMQTDLNQGRGGGFEKLFNLFENDVEAQSHGVFTFKFSEEDVKRSELVAYLIKRLANKSSPAKSDDDTKMFL